MGVKFRAKLQTRIAIFIVSLVFSLLLLDILGIIEQFYERDFDTSFSYPYEGNITGYVQQLRAGEKPQLPPLNVYNQTFLNSAADKCGKNLLLVFVVKSAAGNFERREAVRKTWGAENRFSGINTATVFVTGVVEDPITMQTLESEITVYQDIVHLDFMDSYFNNTLKTVNAIRWGLTYCKDSKFYAFMDDDMYVSVKNLLSFLENPYSYPDNGENLISSPRILYAGNVEYTYPRREKTSKWYIPLSEYPFNKWPPFIPAGCYILSNEALQLIYFTSLYTKMFRFDDIFLSLVAYKGGIRMVHSEHFHMHTHPDTELDFKKVISFHGFSDPFKVWEEQLRANNV